MSYSKEIMTSEILVGKIKSIYVSTEYVNCIVFKFINSTQKKNSSN